MFDSGLQPERTALAWRRTVLALLVGSVVSYRVLAPSIGGWSYAIGTLGVALTGVIWVLSGRRGGRAMRVLAQEGRLDGGGLLLLLGVSVAAAALGGVIFVLF
jgi:Domain of unknown function (DUF202)